MVSTKHLREVLRSWRKLFLENWALFRASRIGVVGLGIMIAFLVIAAAAPLMGLRDPLFWLAPESDVIRVDEWWHQDVQDPASSLYQKCGTIQYAAAFRVEPAAFDARSDRVYFAAGDSLCAISTGTRLAQGGRPAWSSPYKVDANISAQPVVINYGSYVDSVFADHVVLVGTEAGSLYIINDTVPSGSAQPSGSAVVRRSLNGSITGIAAFSEDLNAGRGNLGMDGFVVGTSKGWLYSYAVTPTNYTLRFEQNYTDAPIHLAGGLIKTTEATPRYSPAYIDREGGPEGDVVTFGTEDGWLYAVNVTDGQWRWEQGPVRVQDGGAWTSAPRAGIASEIVPGTPTVIYAATGDGKVCAIRERDGLPLSSWTNLSVGTGGCVPIGRTVFDLDKGRLNTPAIFGPNIVVTSSSGWVYSIRRDPVRGTGGEVKAFPGSTAWSYYDSAFPRDELHQVYFTSGAFVFERSLLVFVAANYNNGTPAQVADDVGILYAVNIAIGNFSWKKTFNGRILGGPVAWADPFNVHESVWVGTEQGDMFAYSTTGQYLAPLPPSWTVSGGYPSGNVYWLGTDAQGRDIYSQLIWGSRIALLIGFSVAFFTILIGVVIGLVAGYLGGRVDVILMRFTDVILVLPGLPLVIILAAVLGAGIGNIILVLSIVAWPGVARVIRAEVLSIKERPFIDSARVTGASKVRIMFRHVLPNVMPLAFLYMTFSVSGAILTEAALSFIGLGDVNTMSWGIMLQLVSQSKALQAWWWLMPPGLAITLISLAFFLVGRAFDEIVNPRLRKR